MLEPFFTTKPQGQGTGLGLAIAREIVRMHRGDIAIERQEPRGTRSASNCRLRRMMGARVLVVDDHLEMAEMLVE